jgi:antitoxin (DNA-binding transcriptional repressor) of toxin-antitoxin stability system
LHQVNLSEAKSKFSELVDHIVSSGEEVVVGLRNVPKVVISPFKSEQKRSGKRELGALKGSVLYMADDFNSTPEEIKDFI